MLSYLFKLLFLVLFSFIVIFTYYYKFSFHIESFQWYTWYIIIMMLVYFFYKWYNYILNKKELIFTPIKLFFFFLIQLFLLSVLFFTLNWSSWNFWFTLFFNIIGYLFFPILFVFSFISFWKYLLWKIKWFSEETDTFKFLSSIWVWFFVFITLLTIFGFFGLYNLYAVFGILISMIWLSYKEFVWVCVWVLKYEIKVPDHSFSDPKSSIFSKINLYLLSSEFLFIVVSFLISINFISIVRPLPIGWDDLWVYMNFPNLMSASGYILNLWSIYTWQVFTGIWYMLSSGTQAFFLNNVWWVLSLLLIVLTFKDLLKSEKNTFINIPLLAWVIFLAMPMIVFQQAKDMKLDPALFFFSGIALYMTYYIFLKYLWYKNEKNIWWVSITTSKDSENETLEVTYKKETKNWFISYFTKYTHIWEDIFSNKTYLIYLFIIWILAWLAFSIKVISLLLISWIIWIIFYSKLWIAWFFSYLSIYIAIFTKWWLWSMMNVVYPKDDKDLINNVFIWWILLWISLFLYSINKYSLKSFKNFLVILWVFLVWVVSWILPWWVKNIYDTQKISVSSIISWKTDNFKIDYTKIYISEELKEIENKAKNTSITESWTTANEDFWRYFWYEKWVNNYLKLPYNLTMQVNQKWEFTDITYIFLALAPLILFLSYKSVWFAIWTFAYLLFTFSLFFIPSVNNYFTNIFSNFNLPFWYIVIWIFFLIPFLYLIYSLNKDKHSVLFKMNLIFGVFYIFLWTISAFWVVWYWISMYYVLLFAFAIWIFYLSWYNKESEDKELFFKFFGSIVVLVIVSIYFFQSSFPHWFNNLKTSWYNNYKAWLQDNYTAIFDAHPDYFNVLVELNIKNEKETEIVKNIISSTKNEKLKSILEQNNITKLIALNEALKEIGRIENQDGNLDINKVKKEASKLRSKIYKKVLYPEKDLKNDLWIYRIWTFLKYFIASNNSRLLEDSLIFSFDKYFYDESSIDIWVDRMKKIWVNYFLVDLNAATIDKDPSKNLTRRYENLLKTFTSKKLELVHSDSICLKIWLENYNKSEKTTDDLNTFKRFAWVNYESYTEDWKIVNRWEKQLDCYKEIIEYVNEEGKIDENNYSYLLPIYNYLKQNEIKSQDELVQFFQNYVWHWWMVLFRIK